MAALLVTRQYSDPCMSGSFSAASARSKKTNSQVGLKAAFCCNLNE